MEMRSLNLVNGMINDNYIKPRYEDEWCDLTNVEVELLGVAGKHVTEPCVVLSSFNAG